MHDTPTPVIGWDIGGANTKASRVVAGKVLAALNRPYELQRDPGRLVTLLGDMARDLGADGGTRHAVTMTAELSQMFRTKREGVAFVLDAVTAAFPQTDVRVFGTDGSFLSVAAARRQPLVVAAANWAATACLVSRDHPDVLIVDVGTTTTDLIPVANGTIVCAGRTDPERLCSGELVYTGALRSPAESLATHVPLGSRQAGVSAEGFALSGDVHLWRGNLTPAEYTVPTPDGRPATREFAGERLARVVCADRDLIDAEAIDAIADALARAQVDRIAAAIRLIVTRHASIQSAMVTGLGVFLGEAAAWQAGLRVHRLSAHLGADAARCAPAAAVALLLDGRIPSADACVAGAGVPHACSGGLRTVVKVGGGLLADVSALPKVLAAIDAARDRGLMIVPGGGPFADAVREASARIALGDDAAHWMAVLAMNQYAHLIASQLPGAIVVTAPQEVSPALASGLVPVLAPYQWLRRCDPLPHSWDVTSDSIAAWIADVTGASRLLLVKPPGARGDGLVDAYFRRILRAGLECSAVAADETGALHAALRA